MYSYCAQLLAQATHLSHEELQTVYYSQVNYPTLRWRFAVEEISGRHKTAITRQAPHCEVGCWLPVHVALPPTQTDGVFFDDVPMSNYGGTVVAWVCVFGMKRALRLMLEAEPLRSIIDLNDPQQARD